MEWYGALILKMKIDSMQYSTLSKPYTLKSKAHQINSKWNQKPNQQFYSRHQ